MILSLKLKIITAIDLHIKRFFAAKAEKNTGCVKRAIHCYTNFKGSDIPSFFLVHNAVL